MAVHNINPPEISAFSGSCPLCNAFLKDNGSWNMKSWYYIRARLVLYSNSCRVWKIWVPATPQIWLPPAALGNSTNPSQSYCKCWPQQCLGDNTVNAHKVNSGCIYTSTFLYQCPYVLQSQHLYVILCVDEASCKFKSSLEEYLRGNRNVLHDQPNYQHRLFNPICPVCYSLLTIICTAVTW